MGWRSFTQRVGVEFAQGGEDIGGRSESHSPRDVRAMTWRRRAAGDASRVGPHHEDSSGRGGRAARSGAGRRVRAVAGSAGAWPPAASSTVRGRHVRGRDSVVVPARDEAARIGPCLDGLRCDADLLEIIVVDDGSTDDTAELAAEAAPASCRPGRRRGLGRQAVGAAARPGVGARRRGRIARRGHPSRAGTRTRAGRAAGRSRSGQRRRPLRLRHGGRTVAAPGVARRPSSIATDLRTPRGGRAQRLVINGQCTAVRRRRCWRSAIRTRPGT